MSRKRTAILISGRGSNMRSLLEASMPPEYPARIALVVSNKPDAEGLTRAASMNIEAACVDHKEYDSREDFEAALQALLVEHEIEIVCLAGFMRILSPEFLTHWGDNILNIHPSLLPSFKGLDTHQRVLDAGVRISGCTVHIVRPDMDSGPIITQAAVPVLPGDDADTLAARVLDAEHRIYPLALELIASGKARVSGERTIFEGVTGEGDGPIVMSPKMD